MFEVRSAPGRIALQVAVTLMVLPGAAHCHNFATGRHRLWDRLNRWITSLPITTDGITA